MAQGRDWISSQFNFDQPSIDYVANHYIYLDHDQRYSVSAGGSYLWQGTRFGGDLIYGSGLRADLPLATPFPTADGPLDAIPNGEELPGYVQVNFSVTHRFDRRRRRAAGIALRRDQRRSTRSIRSATAPASASSRRNSARGAGSSLA